MLSREGKWAFLAFSACGSHFSFCKFDKHLLEICVLLSPSVEEEEWSDGSIQREGMKEKRGGHEGALRWSWPATRGFSIDRVKLETCPSRISSPFHPFLGCFSAASKRKFSTKYACFCIKHFCKILVANFAKNTHASAFLQNLIKSTKQSTGSSNFKKKMLKIK